MVSNISVGSITGGYSTETGQVTYISEDYTYLTITGNNANQNTISGTITFPKTTEFYFLIVGGGGSGGQAIYGGGGGAGGSVYYNNTTIHRTTSGSVSFLIGRGGKGDWSTVMNGQEGGLTNISYYENTVQQVISINGGVCGANNTYTPVSVIQTGTDTTSGNNSFGTSAPGGYSTTTMYWAGDGTTISDIPVLYKSNNNNNYFIASGGARASTDYGGLAGSKTAGGGKSYTASPDGENSTQVGGGGGGGSRINTSPYYPGRGGDGYVALWFKKLDSTFTMTTSSSSIDAFARFSITINSFNASVNDVANNGTFQIKDNLGTIYLNVSLPIQSSYTISCASTSITTLQCIFTSNYPDYFSDSSNESSITITTAKSYYDATNKINIHFTTVGTIATITGFTPDAGTTIFNLNIPTQIYDTTTPGTTYTVTSVGDYAFKDANLVNVTLPSTVITIGEYAFKNTPKLKINLDYIETYDAESFAGCKLFHNTSTGILTIYGRTKTLGSGSLNSCNFTSVVFENNGYNNSLSIGNNCFWSDTLLTTVTIQPRSSISFGASPFYGCSSLQTVILPNGVTNIPADTFFLCTSLTEIYLYCSAIPVIQARAFATTPKIYYLEGATSTTNLPTNKQMLIKISSYSFYVKDTNTVISSPILFNNNAVDFKIVFVYAQSSFNSDNDITVDNGSLSLMTSSDTGFTYKGTFTPTSNTISTTNSLKISPLVVNKYAVQDTIFGWAKSSTTSLIYYVVDTTNAITPFLSSISFPNNDCVLSSTFSPGTFNYTATKVASIPYTLTLTPTAYDTNSTITVNNNSVDSGSPITLTLNISSVNTITIVVIGSTTYTYTVLLSAVTSQSYNVISAFNTIVPTSTQRFQINLDNTTFTAPIVQFVQDVSQNSTGYTSNSVNQRYIFGSSILTNPLELNSTVNSTGTSVSSSVKASNFLLYSDVRLKENIEDLAATQGVDNIRVVQYNNKSDHSKHFGVIAQELAEIYPELVQGLSFDDDTNMQSVSYVELIPICINEIQILKKNQRELQLQLDVLKSELSR